MRVLGSGLRGQLPVARRGYEMGKQRGTGGLVLTVGSSRERKMSEAKKCAHVVCSCVCTDGKKFCSQVCEDSKGVTELSCDCQHPACTGKM